MSDPKRLGGDLIASARADAPSKASRARAAAAIGLGVGAGAATAAATTKASASATAKVATMGLWTKVVAVGAVTVAVGGTAIVATQPSTPQPSPVASASVAPSAMRVASTRLDEIPPPEPLASAPVPSAVPSASAVAVMAPPLPVGAPGDGMDVTHTTVLQRETHAIDVARHQVNDVGNPDAALAALDRHDQTFPNGTLQTEADVLRVDALVAKGDKSAAKKLASQLLARDPASAHAKHLRAVIADAEK